MNQKIHQHCMLIYVDCKVKNCRGTVCETSILNYHICIDMDVKPLLDCNTSLHCHLSEILSDLVFGEIK